MDQISDFSERAREWDEDGKLIKEKSTKSYKDGKLVE